MFDFAGVVRCLCGVPGPGQEPSCGSSFCGHPSEAPMTGVSFGIISGFVETTADTSLSRIANPSSWRSICCLHILETCKCTRLIHEAFAVGVELGGKQTYCCYSFNCLCVDDSTYIRLAYDACVADCQRILPPRALSSMCVVARRGCA